MQVESIQYQVPSHWLSALVNCDYSGLTNEDQRQFDSFCRGEIGGMRRQGYIFIGVDCADESYFAKHHDGAPYGCLPCDVTDCVLSFSK